MTTSVGQAPPSDLCMGVEHVNALTTNRPVESCSDSRLEILDGFPKKLLRGIFLYLWGRHHPVIQVWGLDMPMLQLQIYMLSVSYYSKAKMLRLTLSKAFKCIITFHSFNHLVSTDIQETVDNEQADWSKDSTNPDVTISIQIILSTD